MAAISNTGYGVDVSARRADDLEKRLLQVVKERVGKGEEVRVLDVGCGAGGAAARLAAAASMTGVDMYDFSSDWSSKPGEFLCGDMRKVRVLLKDKTFDYCLCSRTIHYLRYDEAAQVLKDLRRLVQKQLYISFSGITSDMVRGYAAHHQPIQNRFSKLSSVDQNTFGITQPLTLYSEREAIDLLTNTGWKIDWVRTSDFGNTKIIAS